MQINYVIQEELEKQPKWQLMLYLQENGETSAYQIAKDFGWTTGKTHSIVNSLIKSKTVKAKQLVRNGRVSKMIKLVD